MAESSNAQGGFSRVLAALDDVSGTITTPPSMGRKRKATDSGSSNRKKRVASGSSPISGNTPGGSTYGLRELSEVQGTPTPSRRRTISTPTSSGGHARISGWGAGRPGGFNLNYDDETPTKPIDRGGPDQHQKLVEFVNKSIDNLANNLSVKDAMNKLNIREKRELLPGMEIRLLEHQIIGVAWMLEQELRSGYNGGILADDMGLGKTVQMIATMAMNLPDPDDERKTTLIVVPAALLEQWKDEIESKTNDLFTVHIHHGTRKLKTVEALAEKDVIITTYQTLNLDFHIPKDIESSEEATYLAHHGGVLSRMKWYRAVIDEAQFIRNRATKSSCAVAMILARYRWMLTGTPVTNTLADIYGLLRFGRFRPWNDWDDFNRYVAREQVNDAPLAAERVNEILKPIFLRRNKNAKLENGEPILDLPPKDIELRKLEFSEEERELYDSFEKRVRLRVGKFIRERTILKNHAIVLVMILRLRQLCSHPHLILCHAEGYDDPTLVVGSEADKELGRALQCMGAAWVAKVKKSFLARARVTELLDFSDEDDAPDATCPVCHDLYMNDSGRVLVCGHEICFECLMEMRNAPAAHDGEFGHGTEQENLRAEKEYEIAITKGFRPCPTCKKMMDLTPTKVFRSSAFEPSEQELKENSRARRRMIRSPSDLSDEEIRSQSPSPRKGAHLDNSDDELPDMSQLMAERRDGFVMQKQKPVKQKDKVTRPTLTMVKQGAFLEEDIIDLTLEDLPRATTSKTYVDDKQHSAVKYQDSDSDITSPSHAHRKALIEAKQSAQGARPPGNKPKGKGKEKDDGPSDSVVATWRNGGDDLEPSTKMLAMVDLLQEWDATGDKTICYSQWTSMLDLVETYFDRSGIRSLRYDGKMSRDERESALGTFKKLGGPKVILISTKCGGVGLNLVSANRIINLDLSWNYASESQAYDRVHRLGQDKDVFVKRLVVRNTIEERMLQLQDVKIGLADAALGEGTVGARLHKLSVKEIKFLFGMTKKTAPEGGGAGK